MRIRIILLACLAVVLIARPAETESQRLGLGELLEKADLVAVVKLTLVSQPGKIAKARVLKTIKGKVNSESISLLYPQPNIEEMWAHVPPQKGKVLLVFLKKREDGIYVAAFAFTKVRRLAKNGGAIDENVFFAAGGNQCLKVTTAQEANRISGLLAEFIRWDKLNAKQQSELLRSSLKDPQAMRRIALDWLIIDRKVDFNKPNEISDELIEGLLACVKDRDVQVKRDALLAIGMAATHRKDVVPYLVGALDDPATRAIAVIRLDGRRGFGPGPALPPTAKMKEKVAILKKWWAKSGSKNPIFKRFVPPSKKRKPSAE